MTTPTKVISPRRTIPRPRLNRLTLQPEPVGDTLTRAELIAGLRRVVQQARVELAAESDPEEARRHAFAIVCVLDDVAEQFGLTAEERMEILGGHAKEIGGE